MLQTINPDAINIIVIEIVIAAVLWVLLAVLLRGHRVSMQRKMDHLLVPDDE